MNVGTDYTGICTPFYCHDGNGFWLLHKRSQNCRDEQGKWDTGGGKLDFGEDPSTGVLREVEEEYGCKGSIDQALEYYSIIRELEGKKTHWIALPFIIRVGRDEVKNNEPNKIEELGWFRLGEFPEPLHPGVRLALNQYHNIFQRYSQA